MLQRFSPWEACLSLTLLRIAGGRHTQAARARRFRPSPRPGPAARRHPRPGRSAALPFSFVHWRFFPPPFLRQGLAQTRPAPLPARTQASGGRVGIPPSLRALARQGTQSQRTQSQRTARHPAPRAPVRLAPFTPVRAAAGRPHAVCGSFLGRGVGFLRHRGRSEGHGQRGGTPG